MDSSEKTQARTEGPLRHDGDVPSINESLALIVMPQLLAVASVRYVSGPVEVGLGAAALILLSAISGGIVYLNIGNWDGVPQSVSERRYAYGLLGAVPVLGPLAYLLIRN
jgi:hypothetical protein